MLPISDRLDSEKRSVNSSIGLLVGTRSQRYSIRREAEEASMEVPLTLRIAHRHKRIRMGKRFGMGARSLYGFPFKLMFNFVNF